MRWDFFLVSDVVVGFSVFLNSVKIDLVIDFILFVVIIWVFGVVIFLILISCCFNSVKVWGILINMMLGVKCVFSVRFFILVSDFIGVFILLLLLMMGFNRLVFKFLFRFFNVMKEFEI